MYCLLLLCMSFALKKEEREREGDIVTLRCEECTIYWRSYIPCVSLGRRHIRDKNKRAKYFMISQEGRVY